MKEGVSVAEHLNEFNIITNHVTFKIILGDEIIAILLMYSMLDG